MPRIRSYKPDSTFFVIDRFLLMYEHDPFSALDAITEAQRIAFAPMLFQTALCLRNSGICSGTVNLAT